MEPVSIYAAITVAIPFVTALVKKIFTKKLQIPEKTKHGIHALIPLLIGIAAAFLVEFQTSQDWVKALVVGLSTGGVASSARDVEKNLIGIVGVILALTKRKTA